VYIVYLFLWATLTHSLYVKLAGMKLTLWLSGDVLKLFDKTWSLVNINCSLHNQLLWHKQYSREMRIEYKLELFMKATIGISMLRS